MRARVTPRSRIDRVLAFEPPRPSRPSTRFLIHSGVRRAVFHGAILLSDQGQRLKFHHLLSVPIDQLAQHPVATFGRRCDRSPHDRHDQAVRGVFGGLVREHPIELSLIWVAVLLAIFAPLGVWRYRSMSR